MEDKTKEDLVIENEKLREALKYCLSHVAKMFQDIPEGLSPDFYHTLSYEGDKVEQSKIKKFMDLLDDEDYSYKATKTLGW